MQQRPFNRPAIIVAASAAIFLFGGGLSTLGSVIPGIKTRFALDDVSIGTIFSILPLGILTGSLFFGAIADRFGYRLMLGLSCVLMFAGLWGLGNSESYLLLRLSVFAFGMGGGAINGGTSAVVADISEQKGAALSLLGVFFGAGALSLPLIFGTLQPLIGTTPVISGLSILALATGIFIFLLAFPPAKHQEKFPLKDAVHLAKNPLLLFIAFFLFCQSSFEGLINNWTTLYLTRNFAFDLESALFGLSILMIGTTLMRLITGTALKRIAPSTTMYVSLTFILVGVILIHIGNWYPVAASGLFFLGAGLAGGFPVMLGIVGKQFSQLSATAFSFVLVVALFGNMLVNYLMGIVANNYGIGKLIFFCYAELIFMTVLAIAVFRNEKKTNTSSGY